MIIKKANIRKDLKERENYKKEEYKNIKKEIIIKNKIIPIKLRSKYIINKEWETNNRTKIKNRCIITGRGRSVIKRYGVSRIIFRKWIGEGIIPGITKNR